MGRDAIESIETNALVLLRADVEQILAQRKIAIERQLKAISRRVAPSPPPLPLPPLFQSRCNPKDVWSGRGKMPRWMRQEIEGTSLTKEDFKIGSR